MKKILFFDTKPYDKRFFEEQNQHYQLEFIEAKLNIKTAKIAAGYEGVCAFVNDEIDKAVIDTLYHNGTKVLAMRCAGYSNVDIKAAFQKLTIVRVPAYSPYAVAEHAMGLLLAVNRKIHRAHLRTRDFNFNLNGLMGTDLYGKTVGIIGTGKIGRVFMDICKGFGMKIIAYDAFPQKDSLIDYVDLDTIFKNSDVISLHCPLTEQTKHILNKSAFEKMKKGVFIVNTSRGALIDTNALIEAINKDIVRGAGLDVYEEESDLFFEDFSNTVIKDDVLALLMTKPNVIITSHQAFFTEQALTNIAKTTLSNLDAFFENKPLENEICYQCENMNSSNCNQKLTGRCF